MTRLVTTILQIVAGGGHLVLAAIPGITPEGSKLGHAILGVCNIAINVISHNYNPDGTPAKVAYEPTPKA